MLIAELKAVDSLTVGATVYLIRKLSGHVLETELVAVAKLGKPVVEVEWLNQRSFKYKLMLEENQIIALDASQKHRSDMLRLWEIWEPHRELLKRLVYETRRKARK